MTRPTDFEQLLQTSRRVNWPLEDLIGESRQLDFSRPFLPETFVRAASLDFLNARERLLLNQIRTRGYLALFELVESFVVPFMAGQAEQLSDGDGFRAPALRNFVAEEEKHRKLFAAVLSHFDSEFPTSCAFIGPADVICQQILSHSPVAVTIATLGLEWMSQGHYVESVRDDQHLDPPFKSLLKHHWIEEVQHARLDTLVLQSLTRALSAQAIESAIDEYFEIGAFLDGGLRQLAAFDLEALESAARRTFSSADRETFLQVQHRAQEWTFLGCSMGNRNFLKTLHSINDAAARRVEEAAASFVFH